MRICSLLPSATEIVASLGLVESLVAVSEECDWPPEVRALPVVSASRVDTTRLSSFEIDRAVRTAIGDGRPLYAIDRELLEALEPDLILTQNLCAVCAVSAESVDELCATEAEVVALDAHTLAEIEERILSLADLLGVTARGRAVVDEMEAKIAAVRERVGEAAARPVFVAEWLDPPYAAGHWVPEMVALAGGRDVLGRAGAASYPTSWEMVREQRPELIVVAPCGFDHTRCRSRGDAAAARLPSGCRRLERVLRATRAAGRRRCRTARLPHPSRARRRSGTPMRRAHSRTSPPDGDVRRGRPAKSTMKFGPGLRVSS
jgi:iron complex transport system substrate-binding protein